MSDTQIHTEPLIDPMAELLAKQAITEQLYAYCRGIDRMDRTLTRNLWHADGTADYSPHYRGDPDGLIDFVWASHEAFLGHVHHITNVLIELSTPETAVSEAQAIVFLREMTGRTPHVLSIRYIDRWSCRGGSWAVDSRRLVNDVAIQLEVLPAPGSTSDSPARRSPEDPSYAVFQRRFRGDA
ncbi:MAG TPA: nuclear transport factor 2 family protein [Baekduia sp.]|uniref:nuclear transport factor 2 family protein n=1 Tax=Baekduia sp. TaxID=2600305 RepID=UPI002CC3F6A0|nr:nuclear transport factor 2 family protein [Baekduia sp.]HMJ34513.1 nuclear transport factor 2 family protein [Baekduia sp.]